MRRRWVAVPVALVIFVGAGGCGRSAADVQETADLAYAIVVGNSELALTRLAELFPDVPFDRNETSSFSDRWSDCSNSSATREQPLAIAWTSQRGVTVEPRRETATLAQGLVESFVRDGWTLLDDNVVQYDRGFRLGRDGFHMQVTSVVGASDDHTSYIGIFTSSPCLDAPEGQAQWEWSPGPTEPPWPSPVSDGFEPSAGADTVLRPAILERPARAAGSSALEVLPVEPDLFRLYRRHA